MIHVIAKLFGTEILLVFVLLSSVAMAGDVDVRGTAPGDNQPILDVQYDSTSPDDDIAVYGKCAPQGYYGIGGLFEGGWKGVEGRAEMSGSGFRHGGIFYATGGTTRNVGLTGTGVGVGASSLNYGVYANVYGTGASNTAVYAEAGNGATYNYGVFSYAPATSNSYAGYFGGHLVYTGDHYKISDEKVKADIADVENAVEQLAELKPKTYRYRTEEYPDMGLPDGYRMGLISQDVEKVLPEMVSNIAVPNRPVLEGKDKNDNVASTPKTSLKSFLAVDYIQLIPLLVKAIQEQQQQIADIQAEVASLKAK